MPTNRKRITRIRTTTEPWMIEFLLYGEAKHSTQPGGKSILPFCWRPEFQGCFSDAANWRPLWEEIKGDLLPQWRKDNPGKLCWAERELLK